MTLLYSLRSTHVGKKRTMVVTHTLAKHQVTTAEGHKSVFENFPL